VERFAVVGKLAIGDRLEDGAVVVEDGRIAALPRRPHPDDLPARRIEAGIVAPGLIDLQVNGGFGVEVGHDPAAIRHLARALPRTGVTAFLPTVISSPAPVYPGVFDAFRAARDVEGARALGLHLEGPFLSPTRPGAHRQDLIEAADDPLFDALLRYDALALMTLAPERPGGLGRIRRLRERGAVVSLGHLDASYEQFVAGVEAGATMATHLFNAMSPFAHRAPGSVGAALVEDRVVAGLIADGVHCNPAAVRLALAAKGPLGIALVSDMMAAAGMPPGLYELGGRAVESDGDSARLADGTLAGSVLTMDRAVRNVVAWCGVGPATALRMASEVPARLLGLERVGTLAVGADADLALFDGDLSVVTTIVGGRTVYGG